MKSSLALVTLALAALSSMRANPTITIGDVVFTLAHQEKNPQGALREFLPADQTLNAWDRLVSVRELRSVSDPKQYILTFAQQYRAQNPAMKFMVSEDKANGDWLIDFLLVSSAPEARFAEWNVFRAQKAKAGIVVYQYAARVPFKEHVTEISDRLAKMRESMVPIVYSADFQEKEPNKAPEPTTTAVTSPAAQEPRQP